MRINNNIALTLRGLMLVRKHDIEQARKFRTIGGSYRPGTYLRTHIIEHGEINAYLTRS